jgi:hypothetical protein
MSMTRNQCLSIAIVAWLGCVGQAAAANVACPAVATFVPSDAGNEGTEYTVEGDLKWEGQDYRAKVTDDISGLKLVEVTIDNGNGRIMCDYVADAETDVRMVALSTKPFKPVNDAAWSTVKIGSNEGRVCEESKAGMCTFTVGN